MAKALYQQIYEKLRTVKALDPYQFRVALKATASIAERSRRFAHM